jgi:glycosyltransferase involved in cell wall biosynthesis
VPRVSVIIPAYNAAADLPQTLASVQAQTYEDWEIVVADDGSTDDTAAIAQATPRVRLVHTTGRLGPAGARNAALAAAAGELMALLDADDLWDPDLLAVQVARFDREQAATGDVGVVCCDARLLGSTGELDETYADRFGTPEGIDVTGLLRANRIPVIGALAPMALVRELGGFAPETWGSEDHDLWLRILETGRRVVYEPRALAVYRLRAGSVSANAAGMARTNQVTYRRALARGNLDPAQRRLAARELRLHELVERLADRSPRRLAAAVPLAARVALENPARWRRWAQSLRTRQTA